VHPHRLVVLRHRWYLVACPRNSTAWKVYAVGRIEQVQPLGIRLAAPGPPADAAQFVADTLARGPWKHQVHIRVHTSADLVRELVDPSVAVVVSTQDECELHFATDDLDWAARWLVYLNLDLDVVAPPALNDRLGALGEWLHTRYNES
jgi:predicted DNA-binding transcriptional regulator YafY